MLDKLENDMIIKGTVVRLLNENEIRNTDTYHVILDSNGNVRLTQVERVKFGNYVPVGKDTLVISEDGSRKLSDFEFIEFVKILYQPDKERRRMNQADKNDRIAQLLEGISPEDIIHYLRTNNGKAD